MTASHSTSQPISHWRRAQRFIAVPLLSAGLSGCYTTTNVVTVTPLKTAYPVSASGQYLDSNGEVVEEDQYKVVETFNFDKQMAVPRLETGEAPLELQPELDRLVAKHHADAVTDLQISATDYDSGSHGSAATWRIWGWGFGVTGASLAALGASADKYSETGNVMLTGGLVFLGVGVASYLLSYTVNDPAVWHLHVQGKVVKAGAAPTSQ